MLLIGENLHIISKKNREAIENRDKNYVQDLIKKQSSMDWIDLNIGPARKGWEGTMEWLINCANEVTDKPLSLDTTNFGEMRSGLSALKDSKKAIINSTSADPERLEKMTDLAAEFGSYLIALTLSDATGIPKEADERLEVAFNIIEKTSEKGIENGKILLDPLVLPIGVEQSQAIQTLNAIRMFKESFDPCVLTTIGLSNVSNGCPKDNRAFINRIFAVLAMGCGLDTAIVDALDLELIRINEIITKASPSNDADKLLLALYNMMKDFGELEDVKYNEDNTDEVKIYKTAEMLLNKNIYSHTLI